MSVLLREFFHCGSMLFALSAKDLREAVGDLQCLFALVENHIVLGVVEHAIDRVSLRLESSWELKATLKSINRDEVEEVGEGPACLVIG